MDNLNSYNCEIAEILKNIRNLKVQTDLLTGIRLENGDNKLLNLALEDLSVSIFKYLKGDYVDEALSK